MVAYNPELKNALRSIIFLGVKTEFPCVFELIKKPAYPSLYSEILNSILSPVVPIFFL